MVFFSQETKNSRKNQSKLKNEGKKMEMRKAKKPKAKKKKKKKKRMKKQKRKRKVFSTGDSNVVTHHSTNPAHMCLTSEFGWDRVFSHGYDRRRPIPIHFALSKMNIILK